LLYNAKNPSAITIRLVGNFNPAAEFPEVVAAAAAVLVPVAFVELLPVFEEVFVALPLLDNALPVVDEDDSEIVNVV